MMRCGLGRVERGSPTVSDRFLRQIFCTCDMSAKRLRGYFIKLIVIPGPPLMLCEICAAPAIPSASHAGYSGSALPVILPSVPVRPQRRYRCCLSIVWCQCPKWAPGAAGLEYAQRRTRPCSCCAWRVEACDARGGLLRWPDPMGGCAKIVNGGKLIPRQMSRTPQWAYASKTPSSRSGCASRAIVDVNTIRLASRPMP